MEDAAASAAQAEAVEDAAAMARETARVRARLVEAAAADPTAWESVSRTDRKKRPAVGPPTSYACKRTFKGRGDGGGKNQKR